MHCPNCGTSAAKRQKFCRACGFGLAKVVQLLEEGDVFLDGLSREIAEWRQQIERWRNLAFIFFVVARASQSSRSFAMASFTAR